MFTAIKAFFVHVMIAVGIMSAPVAPVAIPEPVPVVVQETTPQASVVQELKTEPVITKKQTVIVTPKPVVVPVPEIQPVEVAPVVIIPPVAPVIVAPEPIIEKKNARCGLSDNNKAKIKPTENLCDIGIASNVQEEATAYAWSCQGIGGGNDSSCRAPKVMDGACGTAANTIVSMIDRSKLCTVQMSAPDYMGGISVNDDQIKWQCMGLYGGHNTDCYAIKAKGQPLGWISYN